MGKINLKSPKPNKCSGGGGNFSCRHPKLWLYIKSNVKAFFITGAITFVVTASATTVKILHSRQVRYKNDKSVESAINELYQKAEQCYDEDGIPLTYTKLEYLESTGTQYIDTGIQTDIDLKFLIEAKINDDLNVSNTGLFGGWNGIEHAQLCTNSNANGWIVQWRYAISSSYGIKDNLKHTHVLDLLNKNYLIDGNQYAITSPIISKSDGTIYVFAVNNSGTVIRKTSLNLYYFQIYDNDILVRDYIPVLDSNNRPCLFDKVSKTCFYNQGTGEFLYG